MDSQEFYKRFKKADFQEVPNKVPEDVLVSVCVQTYQHAKFIRQCLDGILMQETDFAIEILLGEDCSTDGTREICHQYAVAHPEKIRLFLHNEENKIYSDGIKTGRFNYLNNLFSARGKFLAVCEGDDYWTDNQKLAVQAALLEKNPEVGFVHHRVKILNELQNGKIRTSPMYKSRSTFEEMAGLRHAFTSAYFFRKSSVETIPEWLAEIPFADYALSLLATRDGEAAFLPEAMSVYRIHRGGMSRPSNPDPDRSRSLRVLDACERHFSPKAAKAFKSRRASLLADECFYRFNRLELGSFREAFGALKPYWRDLGTRKRTALGLRYLLSFFRPASRLLVRYKS